jgi:hypothetical protein
VEGSTEARLFTAGDEILRVAIDEMRHFRWVNEMLLELGEHWVLDRATVIGIDFPEQKGFNQPFVLSPLTGEQLDWFIKVEKASPNHANPATIDGMYTHILLSIQQGGEFASDPAKRERLGAFVKMIIDEGVDHYARFVRVKNALDGMKENEYLRVTSAPKRAAAASKTKILQDVADGSYAVVLQALDYVFQQDTEQRGELLEAARRAMYNLDAACRSLSELGTGALFTLSVPDGSALAGPAAAAVAASPSTAHEVGDPLRPPLERLRTAKDPGLSQMANRMEAKLAEMITGLAAASRK